MSTNTKTWSFVFAIAAAAMLLPAANASAQELDNVPAVVVAEAPQLVDTVPSSSDLSASKPTTAELRQARAQYRSEQRMRRMERNLWAGYEPLRPNWNAIPMMTSRFPMTPRTIVPVYVYPW